MANENPLAKRRPGRWERALVLGALLLGGTSSRPAAAQALEPVACTQTVTARVVAIDQVYSYDRYGAYNPVGMLYALRRDVVAIDPSQPVGPGNARLRDGKRPRPLVLRVNKGDCLQVHFTNWLAPTRALIPAPATPAYLAQDGKDHRNDAPATRLASLHINGLQPLTLGSDGSNVGRNASSLAAPGESRSSLFLADREGTFLAQSLGAIGGGEGDGGSLTLGLFGAVNVEPAGSRWYRSQVTAEQLRAAQRRSATGEPLTNPDGTPLLDFEAVDASGTPLLRMTDAQNELVHADLNALVVEYERSAYGTLTSLDQGQFREFTVIFHGQLKAVQAFPELEERQMLHGVRDGFGINYGAAGMGAEVLANRKRLGPTKDCIECKFEEFFLESWANGDPALNLEVDARGKPLAALYPDDPSNVHHSYLGDPVRFRNLHAGPQETHVFHLHGHQWRFEPNQDDSNYIDSQTIGPGAAFTYDINYGGSGNRNLTVGDSIFHCHLYPHFAQGMWGLWRTHDVFEAGTPDRNLPDGELAAGTPNPAVVPLPERAMPPLPTYAPTEQVLADGTRVTRPAMPGFPFYIAAKAGHRPPQPPLDVEFSGGLPRHIITSVPRTPEAVTYGRRGEFDVEIHQANLKLLPEDGTPLEQGGMAFHAGQFPGATRVTTPYGWPAAAYPGFTAEGSSGQFLVNGQPPRPGAPFADPCLPGAAERAYRASYVQLDLTVNAQGWHDPQARIIVLDGDVPATLAGTRPPEPFFFRANSGECITFHATNLIPDVLQADDFQIFTPTDIIGQHIHLVKFDVTSSDGAGNGWNYEDGTFAAEEVRARIAAANALGGALVADGTLEESGARVTLKAQAHPRLPGAPLGAQTTVQRWYADPQLSSRGTDRTLRTVFTHDHFGPSSHQHHGLYGALIVEPPGSTWRDPATGLALGGRDDGGPTSWRADILTGAAGEDSYREFNLALADFAIVYDAYGLPVNPPTTKEAPLPRAVEHPEGVVAPEAISAADPGTSLINYRNEPIPLRIATRNGPRSWTQRPGAAGDLAQVFSSNTHGDPFTPLMRGYEGDRVRIHLVQGAQEEQHVFSVNGHKWLREEADPDSGYTNSQEVGISEAFHFLLSGGLPTVRNAKQTADYLYLSTPTDDLWNGLWGILRAYNKAQPDLLALPNNADMQAGPVAQAACPPPGEAPRREYRVHAIAASNKLPGGRLVYNAEYDLYDPDAVLFVKEEHLPRLKSGARLPEPLVLRAAAGECVQVTLVNSLPSTLSKTPHWNYNPPITEGFNVNQVLPSRHVSLHPQLVHYDVNRGDGANVGFNLEQTVAPGKSITYQWYAGELQPVPGSAEFKAVPIELGAINLRDMADVVNHSMHGAVGTLIIEPKGATWTVAEHRDSEATVTYTDPSGAPQSFRELVYVYQDEVALHSGLARFQDTALNSGTALRNYGGTDDAEDTGHKGLNYRTEPFWARLGVPPHTPPGKLNDLQYGDIFSSAVHGDPATPVFTVPVGQAVRIRVVQPSGHTRQHAFTLHGAEWPRNFWAAGSQSRVAGFNPFTTVLSTQGGHSAMRAWNLSLLYGAGGRARLTGDFLFREQSSSQLGGGLWSIVRVTP